MSPVRSSASAAGRYFLFSQPRPIVTVTQSGKDWTTEDLAQAVDSELRDHFTDLATDLEAFNSEPVV